METSESWNFCHLVLDYSHKADNTARKWDRTRLEGDLYSPPTGRSENCTYLSKWRAYLSHINHCCNWNREKAFEMLNKTFFNGVRCHPLLFIVGVYSESFIFSLCDNLCMKEMALSQIETDHFWSCITHRHPNRQQIMLCALLQQEDI